jgi:hypothetical protein
MRFDNVTGGGRRKAVCRLTFALALAASTLPGVAMAAKGGTDRPHLGTCATVVNPQPSGVLAIDLACQFRHLGRTTGLLMLTVVPTGAPVGGKLPVAISGPVTYKAANGDELRALFSGTGEIDLATGDVEFGGVENYSGGTGRFADASGQSTLEGTASQATNTGFYVTAGRISY